MIRFTQPAATHVCATPDCTSREWQVERDRDVRELWYLRSRRGVFTMASHKAVCPICGGALLEIAALEPALEPNAHPAHQIEAGLRA